MRPYDLVYREVEGKRRGGCCYRAAIVALAIALALVAIGCAREVASAAETGTRTKEVTVTAYNSGPWQTDSTPRLSADGSDICALEALGDHSCAAALPFGTRIRVPGFGTCTVRDRLARKYSYRIDLHFGGAERIKAARQWGKQRVSVTIINGD